MNPIIHGTPKDRTGSAAIVRRANAEISRRFAGLQRDVLTMFDGITVYAVNKEVGGFLYGLSPEQMAALSDELAATLDRWIAAGKDPANLFWWDAYVQDSAQLGTAQAVANLSNLSAAYASTRTLEAVIYSTPYKTRLGMAQVKSYEHWRGLAATSRAELSQIIGRAVVDGKNPKAVKKEIAERLGVSKEKALSYAQTDITDTLRQARWAEDDYAQESLGLKLGELWTSALIPTTRSWHAIRNGKVYSTDEVRKFYSENGNRYNCRCGQTSCLLDENGKPILTKKLQSAMASERKAWQSQHG
jgi:SPP1 gp7 family putative phage head morphogenesis protein